MSACRWLKCWRWTARRAKPGGAKSKVTVYYDFTRANSDLLLDIIHAFGIASQPHNEDIRQILGKILETAGN